MFNLEEIGLTKEDIQERVVDRIASIIMDERGDDEDGGEGYYRSKIADKLNKKIKDHIDERISKIGEEIIRPNIAFIIENAVFEKTNQWGDKLKEPAFTLKDYLIKKSEEFLLEDVDREAKSRSENGGYSFTKAGSRINVLINRAIGDDVATAVKKFMSDAVESLKTTISASIVTHLNGINERIKKV